MPCHPSTSDDGKHVIVLTAWVVLTVAPWMMHLAAVEQVIPASLFWVAGPLAATCWFAWRQLVPPECLPDEDSILGLATACLWVSTVLLIIHTAAALVAFTIWGVGSELYWAWAMWLLLGSVAVVAVWRKALRRRAATSGWSS